MHVVVEIVKVQAQSNIEKAQKIVQIIEHPDRKVIALLEIIKAQEQNEDCQWV